jgi:phospholipid transport system substrate-binding protein
MRPQHTARIAAAILGLAILSTPASLSLLPSVALAATEADAPDAHPEQVVSDVARRLFAALDANRVAIRTNPEAIYPLVDTILLPHFDTEYAAQLVLAQHWRAATPAQRKRFVDAFYHALLRTYGGALAGATAGQLKLLPLRGDPAATQVIVRTEVTRSGGGVVPVDYRLHKTSDGWKAFDVIIQGISYVRNYRTDFDAEISAKGLDAAFVRIEKEGLARNAPEVPSPSVAANRH